MSDLSLATMDELVTELEQRVTARADAALVLCVTRTNDDDSNNNETQTLTLWRGNIYACDGLAGHLARRVRREVDEGQKNTEE